MNPIAVTIEKAATYVPRLLQVIIAGAPYAQLEMAFRGLSCVGFVGFGKDEMRVSLCH